MKYKKKINDLGEALGLTKDQVHRCKQVLAKAYHELPDKDFSIDEINFLVAPHISTKEEAYFIAQTLVIDVITASTHTG